MERETLRMALYGITKVPTLTHGTLVKLADVEAAINEALAQPAQERQWIWLSDADIAEVVDTTCQYTGGYEEYLIKKAERKIRSMNNGT